MSVELSCFCVEVTTLTSSQMESLILTDVTNIQKQRSSTLNKPLDGISTKYRTMQSGPCTATTYWGKRVITCDCTEGIFDVPLNKTGAGDTSCDNCGHSLLQHASIIRSDHSMTGNLLSNRALLISLTYRFIHRPLSRATQ